MHPDPYDSIDNYLPIATDIGKAAVPLGLFLAWCANLRLLNQTVEQDHERLILRIRMQETHGSELLVAMGGELSDNIFSDGGNAFMRRYYSGYLEDYKETFAVSDETLCSVQETWDNYAKLAAVLTPQLLGRKRVGSGIWSKLKARLWPST